MKKPLVWLVIVVVVVGGGMYLYARSKTPGTTAPTQTQTSTSIAPTSTHVLVNTVGLLEDKVDFPVKNAATGDVVSIKNTGIAAQNPSSFIYLNQAKVGEISGYSSMATFSPHNKYFAVLQTMNVGCAGGCLGFSIFVIDLAHGTTISVQPQPAPHNEFVESYAWDGDDAINVTSYPVSDSYRTSPKQIWHYDLKTGSATLVSTLP
jgi:archaellin